MQKKQHPINLSRIIVPFFKEFESLLEDFERSAISQSAKSKGFPPMDVSVYSGENIDEPNNNKKTISVIEMAVAGFEKDDFSFEIGYKRMNNQQRVNVLTISGRKSDTFKKDREALKQKRQYIVEGLSFKNFQKEFIVFDKVEKIEPSLKDGILTVLVYEEKPEPSEPMKIDW